MEETFAAGSLISRVARKYGVYECSITGPSASEVIEIELANGYRLRVDRDVDADALRRVLSALVAA